MLLICTPPIKKKTPIVSANFNLWLTAILEAKNAPQKVPIEWAKKGIRKCMGSNRWIFEDKLSRSSGTTPLGKAINAELFEMINIFVNPPINTPTTIANIFLTIFFTVNHVN